MLTILNPCCIRGHPCPSSVLRDKTGDFLPYIGNDVGVLETSGRRVVVSIFTANHFGLGILEEAIGRITEQVADYLGNR